MSLSSSCLLCLNYKQIYILCEQRCFANGAQKKSSIQFLLFIYLYQSTVGNMNT